MSTRIRPLGALRPFKGKRIAPRVPGDVTAGRKRVPDVISAEVLGRKIFPEVAIYKPCIRKNATTLRKCHVELVFVGDKLAAARGVPPGSYMQLCSKFGQPGNLVAVAGHVEANRVAKEFCGCRKRGESAAVCAKTFSVKETR